ncbi:MULTISPECIES: hypothetical protein [unclassified Paenibacillus]|uniref:hypothetical protein n=1 Tax=unclassified Paenibacillus TaxID=185978 RepID=UPI003632036A
MILELIGKQYEFENNTEEIPSILQTIESSVSTHSLYVQSIVVDEQEVHVPLDDYILEHIETVDRIEIVTVDHKEMVSSLVSEGTDYLARALPSMNQLADRFYQNPDKETWARLDHFLEAIGWFDTILGTLSQVFTEDTNIDTIRNDLQARLVDFQESLLNQDTVLIADMIIYEFMPLFENLQTSLDAIKNEVKEYDTN